MSFCKASSHAVFEKSFLGTVTLKPSFYFEIEANIPFS